jgi:Mg2+-importing ATPase
MVKTTATVRRRLQAEGSHVQEVPIDQLAPGDIVQLSAGDLVPADLRLLATKDLHVNQAALTGEAMPVDKYEREPDTTVTDPFDLPNPCFMGSDAATGLVLRTGGQTDFGRLADSVVGQRVQTDFDKGIASFTWLMIRFICVMVPMVFLINGLTKGDWLEALLFAVAVAVGLMPEMLPMIVTVNLAKGAIAMARKRVIVKRLNTIQNFGAMNVLCTDKTGTLTQDRIILQYHLDFEGEESARVLEYAFLNSHYQSGLNNLLDEAVLRHAQHPEHAGLAARFAKWTKSHSTSSAGGCRSCWIVVTARIY